MMLMVPTMEVAALLVLDASYTHLLYHCFAQVLHRGSIPHTQSAWFILATAKLCCGAAGLISYAGNWVGQGSSILIQQQPPNPADAFPLLPHAGSQGAIAPYTTRALPLRSCWVQRG